MSVRMRHTRAHTANRRSHHALTEPRLSKCENCGAFSLRHRACNECGKYRGRVVIDVTASVLKKEEKKKAKQSAQKAETDTKEEKKEEKLSPEELSKK